MACASHRSEGTLATGFTQRVRRVLHSRFPLILDEYVMRAFVRNFVLTLTVLVAVFLIFTFFELIGDIIRYRTPLVTVGLYLLNLIPFILYNVTPLCSLVAVLITFGTLSRTSELTSMKATGISLYRIVAPILLVAAVLSVALFAFDEVYLPGANRRQEALRATIKGKPAQTFLRPDRNWISGQTGRRQPARAHLLLPVLRPATRRFRQPHRLRVQARHIRPAAPHFRAERALGREHRPVGFRKRLAAHLRWRSRRKSYAPFTLSTFPEIHEQPGYFKKEDRPSQEMSYGELSTSYIGDLKQSGFDTMRLRVQLNRKLAYPLVTLVMAMLAIPFALSAGKKGSLAGMGAAIGVAIAYWVVAGIFENLGDVNSLPAVLAAWSPDLLFGMAGAWLLLRTTDVRLSLAKSASPWTPVPDKLKADMTPSTTLRILTSTALLSAAATTFAQAPTKPATTRPATTAVHHTAPAAHTAGGPACSKLPPEMSPKIPALAAGLPCVKPLYTIVTTPNVKLDYVSPLEGPGLRETLGLESSSFSLDYVDTKIGTGALAAPGKWYSIHYTGYLLDGTKFDSSLDRGEPIVIQYGQHQVIPGWDTGFDGMRVGGKRRLFIPFQLAYGTQAKGPIPPRSELIFDVEFVGQSDTKPEPKPAPAPAKPATPPPAALTAPAATPAPSTATPPPARRAAAPANAPKP